MKDPQRKTSTELLHVYHTLTRWIIELGRAFTFATTTAIIICIIMSDEISYFHVAIFLALGGVMMFIGVGLEYWLMRKKFDAINRY